ncbi:HNH endonuclease [Idiomarina loihiensis]|uniref:HNH endonuclease signature motif containing protein n=1 Tax=Idiomarina TaxID=135575 RepID=UPI000D716902|nr:MULTISPECIES: HNH endonuclease signature motif containing protein [Idiomarina]PWW38568.1 HNH endonuclease [Idiomarina loihiensis]TDP48358.1 HNH endonuclease [Idiomarina loihiensis]TDS23524.1 HNH endonuclease [Idiomarina sp. H2]
MNNKKEFSFWMLQQRLSKITIEKYLNAIDGRLSHICKDSRITESNLFEIDNYDYFILVENILKNQIEFKDLNLKGNYMYSSALNYLRAFLKDTKDTIDSKSNEYSLKSTEIKSSIYTRVGQELFRAVLISHWKGCAVTGFGDKRMLLASHIKPWSVSSDNERLNLFNGLLLLPHYDCAFDKGLITFSLCGRIKISPEFYKPERASISESAFINISAEHAPYMSYHNKKIFIH